eukprot:gene15022-17753_t
MSILRMTMMSEKGYDAVVMFQRGESKDPAAEEAEVNEPVQRYSYDDLLLSMNRESPFEDTATEGAANDGVEGVKDLNPLHMRRLPSQPSIRGSINTILHADLRPIMSWWLLCAFGNLMQLLSAIHAIKNGRPDGSRAIGVAFGLGALVGWLNLVRYLEFDIKLYIIMRTVERALPDVCRVIVGSSPFFIGYALLGMATYGMYLPQYSNLMTTTETLFALLAGDSVLDILSATDTAIGGYFGCVYIFSFMLFFMYVVMNVIVSVGYTTFAGALLLT